MYSIEVIKSQDFAILQFSNRDIMLRLALHSDDVIPVATFNAVMVGYTLNELNRLIKKFFNSDVITIKELN